MLKKLIKQMSKFYAFFLKHCQKKTEQKKNKNKKTAKKSSHQYGGSSNDDGSSEEDKNLNSKVTDSTANIYWLSLKLLFLGCSFCNGN